MAPALSLCVLTILTPAASPPGPAPWAVDVGLSGDKLVARARTLRGSGYRLAGLSGYTYGEDVYFAAVWHRAKGPAWTIDYGLTPPQLDRRAADLKGEGYRPVVLSGYDQARTQGFAALWQEKEGPAWDVEYGIDAEGLQRSAARMKEKGYRPVGLSSYVWGTISRYAVLSEKSDVAWRMSWGLSADALNDALNDGTAEGYRPVALCGLGVELQESFSCVWEKRAGPAWLTRVGLDAAGVTDLARLMRVRGYRPVSLTGYTTLRGPRFATIWEKDTGK